LSKATTFYKRALNPKEEQACSSSVFLPMEWTVWSHLLLIPRPLPFRDPRLPPDMGWEIKGGAKGGAKEGRGRGEGGAKEEPGTGAAVWPLNNVPSSSSSPSSSLHPFLSFSSPRAHGSLQQRPCCAPRHLNIKQILLLLLSCLDDVERWRRRAGGRYETRNSLHTADASAWSGQRRKFLFQQKGARFM
jgi:hypothetical protein